VTPELIQKRLEELQSQAKQYEALLMQISGAIQDCNYWLTVGEKNATEEIDKPESV
jgi:hypothetical protein